MKLQKNRNMSKKGMSSLVLIIIIILVALLIFLTYISMANFLVNKAECLSKPAEEFCNQKGFQIGGIYGNIFGTNFNFECLDERRAIDFKFTKQELEDCS